MGAVTDAVVASVDRMFAAWNEPDPTRIRELIEPALSPDIHFVDPSIDLTGVDAFEANMHHVHAQIPGASYTRASAIDAHHGYLRYHWAIHRDGTLLLAGFDVTRVDDDGRIAEVIGFFGPLDPG